MNKLTTTLLISIFFAACGGTGETNKVSNSANTANTANTTNPTATNTAAQKPAPDMSNPKMTVTIDGKEMVFDAKYAVFTQEKVTITRDGKNETAAQLVFRVSNFDLPSAKGKQPTGDEKMVTFVIVSVPGTDEKTVLATGDYIVPLFAGEKTSKFTVTNKVGAMYIESGKPIEKALATSQLKGKTKLITSTSDAISGEVDFTDGSITIKGTFNAKKMAK